ncbi:MAG TPA: CBS domain-containing protein [Candidatus Limnocylindria bacterium]
MGPRAAWRLESLGFSNVFWYRAGKADWGAAGLPVAGRAAHVPTLGHHARRDVPTCRPDEPVSAVSGRVRAAGWNTCFVVTADRVVLGRLHDTELDGRGDVPARDAMRNGPSTWRPNVTVDEMLDRMREEGLTTAPVTDSEGRLVGLALIEDLEAAHAVGDRGTSRGGEGAG